MKPPGFEGKPYAEPGRRRGRRERRSERERARGNVESDETSQTKMNEQEVAVQISQMVQVSPAADEPLTPPPMPFCRALLLLLLFA